MEIIDIIIVIVYLFAIVLVGLLAQKKACVSIHQSNLKNRDLEKTISNLFTNNKNLEELENNIEKFCNKDSNKLIVKEILEEIK